MGVVQYGHAYVALGDYQSASIAYDKAFSLDLPYRDAVVPVWPV